MNTVVFYYNGEDSIILGWKEGLEDCGVNNFVPIQKSLLKPQPIDFTPDLRILENPTEFELDILSETKSIKTICVVGCEYKKFYKKYPFINLWVEPVFYDKITEKSFNNDNLPFYYCPLASQESLIPFYTELNREYDFSTEELLRVDGLKVKTISKNDPHPEIIYGNTKVNLNYQIPKKDFVYFNQKSFDIPMSGNFELSTIPEVSQIFENKVGYTSESEMLDKIKYYIEHEEDRTRMSIKAYEIIIRDHVYSYRMRDLLNKLNTL